MFSPDAVQGFRSPIDRGFVDRSGWVARLDRDLRTKVFPYWLRGSVDSIRGGYRVDDTHHTWRDRVRGLSTRLGLGGQGMTPSGPSRGHDTHLVSQSRLLYVFSLAHRLGYGGGGRQYLDAALHGYRFLRERMRDEEHGGYFWRVNSDGTVTDAKKWLYGQSFALYALVEFHRASGHPDALAEARALFATVEDRMKDRVYGGWVELAGPDFSVLPPGQPIRESGMHHTTGIKTANGHLHWMEALSELLAVTGDSTVRGSLEEVLRLSVEIFFASPGVSPLEVTADWSPAPGESRNPMNYGHNLEFAWLMLRAQRVLGAPPGLELFDALLSHSLEHGFDMERGGFYANGERGAAPALDTSKVWWVQAEGLAALSDALATEGAGERPRNERCLGLLLDWIWRYQRLADGCWVWSTEAAGKIQVPTKAGHWKAGYHEVRAMAKFVGALSG